MIEKFLWNRFDFWNEEREKQQNDTKLKIFRKSNTNFRKFLRKKHKEDTKLRIFINQKGTKNMQNRKTKRKVKACNWHQT